MPRLSKTATTQDETKTKKTKSKVVEEDKTEPTEEQEPKKTKSKVVEEDKTEEQETKKVETKTTRGRKVKVAEPVIETEKEDDNPQEESKWGYNEEERVVPDKTEKQEEAEEQPKQSLLEKVKLRQETFKPNVFTKKVNNYKQDGNKPQRTQQHNTANKLERGRSHALKFNYDDYRTIDHPVNKMQTQDLVRYLVTRSFDEGQIELRRSLEHILRAFNFECGFPTYAPPFKSKQQE